LVATFLVVAPFEIGGVLVFDYLIDAVHTLPLSKAQRQEAPQPRNRYAFLATLPGGNKAAQKAPSLNG